MPFPTTGDRGYGSWPTPGRRCCYDEPPSSPLPRRSAFLRLLAAQLHLAVSPGAALAVVLRAALDGERIVGHVLGDDRAGADIGAVADFHRRHQRGVGADEGALADNGLVLGKAVIVAGDGAGAEIGIGSDMGVADIG